MVLSGEIGMDSATLTRMEVWEIFFEIVDIRTSSLLEVKVDARFFGILCVEFVVDEVRLGEGMVDGVPAVRLSAEGCHSKP